MASKDVTEKATVNAETAPDPDEDDLDDLDGTAFSVYNTVKRSF